MLDYRLIEVVSAELIALLGDEFDPATFWDTLDGETDVMDILGAILRDRMEAAVFEAANKAAADEYSTRARKFAERQKALSKALGKILDMTGQKKVQHPLGTVSRIAGRASVEITDETLVPRELCQITVSPDKKAIKEALESGESVPGAALSIGDPSVSVRVK